MPFLNRSPGSIPGPSTSESPLPQPKGRTYLPVPVRERDSQLKRGAALGETLCGVPFSVSALARLHLVPQLVERLEPGGLHVDPALGGQPLNRLKPRLKLRVRFV